MKTLQRTGLLIAAGTALLLLAACGGGGGSTPATASTNDTPQDSPNPTPGGAAFAAFGSSAHTVSLGWQRPAGSATYAIERKAVGGD
jgi:hypothetical protein